MGRGNMLFKPLGTSRLQRVQGAYVGEEEIALMVKHWRAQGEQELEESMRRSRNGRVKGTRRSRKFSTRTTIRCSRSAPEIVIETQTASVSLLSGASRGLYARRPPHRHARAAGRDLHGSEGSKPRRVLVAESDLAQTGQPVGVGDRLRVCRGSRSSAATASG